MLKGTQEGVILVVHENELYCIRKDSTVKWYKLTELTFGDFITMTAADQAN